MVSSSRSPDSPTTESSSSWTERPPVGVGQPSSSPHSLGLLLDALRALDRARVALDHSRCSGPLFVRLDADLGFAIARLRSLTNAP